MARFFILILLLLTCLSSSSWADNSKTLDLGKGIKLNLVERKFDKSKAKIDYCRKGRYVCNINGRHPFGVDGTIPETELVSMQLFTAGKQYNLDTSGMYNAWGNRPVRIKNLKYMAASCIDSKNCTVRGIFSDAAGSYVGEWQIHDGVPVRTILTESNDIVGLFLTNLDPPEFD